MTTNNTYLAVFLGSKTSARRAAWDALPEGERRAKEREGMLAWKAWVEKHQAAIVAITNAAPFAPLPTGSKSPIPIEFRFDYNVFKASTQMVASGPSTSSIKSLEDEAQQQLTAAEGAKDELAQVAALISLGDCSRAQANFTGAEGFYNRALNLVKLKDDRKFEHSKVLGRFALMQSAQGKNQEADTQFKEAFKLAKEAGKNQLDPDVTEMLTEYAKFLYKSSRFDEANKIYTMLKQ